MSDLSDRVKAENLTDEYWDINHRVIGANFVSVRPSHNNSHLNLYFHNDGEFSQIEVPDAKVNISDTKYGAIISNK